MDERREQILNNIIDVFNTYSKCIVSRIEFMRENADLDNKTPFTAPFENFSSHVRTLCEVGEKIIGLLQKQ